MGECAELLERGEMLDDYRRHRSLWAGVVRLAIADAQLKGRNFSGLRKDAVNWIFDDRRAVEANSFVSICGLLDLPPDRVRHKIRKILGTRGLD